jgi:hypothetical protein
MAVMAKFLANMPQKSRAYYTKAGTRYKVQDTRKADTSCKISRYKGTRQGGFGIGLGQNRGFFRPLYLVSDFNRQKKGRGVNHARTTTRRMEEPCGIQLVGAGCQNLADSLDISKFHASLKFAAAAKYN